MWLFLSPFGVNSGNFLDTFFAFSRGCLGVWGLTQGVLAAGRGRMVVFCMVSKGGVFAMISVEVPAGLSKAQRYRLILARLGGIVASERDALANLCNCMAYLYWTLGDVNWTGVYVLREGELVLGPFGGKPACSRIALDRGVCGACARTRTAQLVPDVHAFPGHIACDDASRSELVVPVYAHGELWGVLDVDSPLANRFDAEDLAGLEKVAKLVGEIAQGLRL